MVGPPRGECVLMSVCMSSLDSGNIGKPVFTRWYVSQLRSGQGGPRGDRESDREVDRQLAWT